MLHFLRTHGGNPLNAVFSADVIIADIHVAEHEFDPAEQRRMLSREIVGISFYPPAHIRQKASLQVELADRGSAPVLRNVPGKRIGVIFGSGFRCRIVGYEIDKLLIRHIAHIKMELPEKRPDP